jgi:hypothetical protein
MIFPNLELEDVVQVNDKTRLNCTKSFISKDEADITLIEIEPHTGDGFITVGSPGSQADWYLDWQYSTAGTKTVSCKITTDGSPITVTKNIEVLSVADDNLFSSDNDLTAQESDILKYVEKGRNSFLKFHRQAQRNIIAWLDENGQTDSNGNRLTKEAVVDIEEVRYWSAGETLRLIFQSLSNAVDDVFARKSIYYETVAKGHRNRAILRLDTNGDGEVGISEGIKIKTLDLIRR